MPDPGSISSSISSENAAELVRQQRDANKQHSQTAPESKPTEPTPAPPQPKAVNPMDTKAPGSPIAKPSGIAEELPVPGQKANEASDKAWGDSGAKVLNPGDKFKLGGGEFPKGYDQGTVVANHQTSDLKVFDKMADVAALENKLKSFDGKSNEFKSFLKEALANSDAKLTDADVAKYTDRKAGNEYGAAGAVMSEDGKGIKLKDTSDKGKYFEIGYGKEGSERSYAKVYLNDLAKVGAGSTVPAIDPKAGVAPKAGVDPKAPADPKAGVAPKAGVDPKAPADSKASADSVAQNKFIPTNDEMNILNSLTFSDQSHKDRILDLKDGESFVASHISNGDPDYKYQYYNLGNQLYWGQPDRDVIQKLTDPNESTDTTPTNFYAVAGSENNDGKFKLVGQLEKVALSDLPVTSEKDGLFQYKSQINNDDVISLYQFSQKIIPSQDGIYKIQTQTKNPFTENYDSWIQSIRYSKEHGGFLLEF